MSNRDNRMKPRLAISAAICAALALPLLADPVQVDPADYERTFNVRFPGYRGTTTLTDFPALIRLSASLNEFDYSKCADGANLRFADSEGNLIPHEIDTWNPSGTSLVWVKVPSLSKETKIRVCYGYKGSAAQPAVTASDVWDSGYVGVWHMNAAADSLTQSDSTGNGHTFVLPQSYADNVVPGVAGVAGGAADFGWRSDKKGSYGCSDTNGDFTGHDTITVEYWTFQTAVPTSNDYMFMVKNSSTNVYSMYQRQDDGRFSTAFYRIDPQNDYAANDYLVLWPGSDHPAPTISAWNHHAEVFNCPGRYIAGFQNGKRIAYSTSAALKTSRTPSDATQAISQRGFVYLGNLDDQWSGRTFHGSMDEVRFSRVARSDDWVAASYDTVANAAFANYEKENDWTRYSHKFYVSFDGYTGESTLEDFPVLVKIAEYDENTGTGLKGFSYSHCLKPHGGDLCFADEDGNMLPCEIDTWDESGTSLVWVKVPSLNASTKLTAYYGWLLAPVLPSSYVWDSGFIGVWHLGGGGLSQSDSTANALDMVNRLYPEGIDPTVSGVLGGAVEFNKSETTTYGALSLMDTRGHFDGLHALTLEAWTYQDDHDPGTATRSSHILKSGLGGKGDVFHMYEAESGTTSTYFFAVTNGVTYNQFISNSGIKPGRAQWNYQVRKYDSETAQLGIFMNGTSYAVESWCYNTGCTGTVTTVTGTRFYIGNTWDDTYGSTPYPGKIDEVRVSNVFRSDDWLKATYDTIANNATFTTYSAVRENIKGFTLLVR